MLVIPLKSYKIVYSLKEKISLKKHDNENDRHH